VPYAGVDPANGDALFLDENGETLSNTTPGSARRVLGNPLPDLQGGITSEFSYKNFDASLFFQYATGHQLYLSEGRFYGGNFASVWNQTTDALNAWTPENTDTDIPQARLFQTNGSQHSGRWLSDADYIRLRNVQVGYTTPEFGPSGTRARIFFSGQNLLTFTDFAGLDPEASGQDQEDEVQGSIFFSRPQNKRYTFGVNFTF